MVSASLARSIPLRRGAGGSAAPETQNLQSAAACELQRKNATAREPVRILFVSVIFAGRNSKYVSIRALDGAMSRVSHGYPDALVFIFIVWMGGVRQPPR